MGSPGRSVQVALGEAGGAGGTTDVLAVEAEGLPRRVAGSTQSGAPFKRGPGPGGRSPPAWAPAGGGGAGGGPGREVAVSAWLTGAASRARNTATPGTARSFQASRSVPTDYSPGEGGLFAALCFLKEQLI